MHFNFPYMFDFWADQGDDCISPSEAFYDIARKYAGM